MKKLKKRSGILVRAVCVAAGAFLACFAGYAAGTGVLPLNTIEDVAPEAPSFSKNDFVGSLQEALRTGTISDALSLYGSLPADYAEDTDLLLLKASLLISDSRFDDAKKICTALQNHYFEFFCRYEQKNVYLCTRLRKMPSEKAVIAHRKHIINSQL